MAHIRRTASRAQRNKAAGRTKELNTIRNMALVSGSVEKRQSKLANWKLEAVIEAVDCRFMKTVGRRRAQRRYCSVNSSYKTEEHKLWQAAGKGDDNV